MIRSCILGVLCAACVWGARNAAAADLSNLSEGERKQLNEWMAKRAELMIEANKVEREVGSAWQNSSYTSAEVEALRKQYRGLQDDLLRTQRAIQDKVLELPALQSKTNTLATMRASAKELSKKIAEKTGE